jgi:hypothetical protein
LEGISDEFSDRDFAIIWGDSVPNANKRLEAAKKLGFDVHEIKDVISTGESFDLFSDGRELFNIGWGTSEKESKWYESLNDESIPPDAEEILMSICALDTAKIYFQKNGWVDELKEKVKITQKARRRIIDKYIVKTGIDLKLLEKSSKRGDLIQFLKYLERILRSFQIIYLLKNNKPVVSSKFFEKRFAKIEDGEITQLIRYIADRFNMSDICVKVLEVARNLNIKMSEKLRA